MSVSDITDDIKLAETLYNEDRLIESMQVLRNINFHIDRLENNVELKAVVESSAVCQKIIESGKKTSEHLELLNTDTSWHVWNNDVGINQDMKVSIYKDTQHRDSRYQFKIEGKIHGCDMECVIAALLENDLYRYFMPLCSQSECYKVMSPSRRCIRSEFDFVLFKRESYLSVHSDVLPDGDGVLLQFSPLTRDEESSTGISKADSADEEEVPLALKRQYDALTREICQENEISKILQAKTDPTKEGNESKTHKDEGVQCKTPQLILHGAIMVKEEKVKAKVHGRSQLLEVYDDTAQAYSTRPSMQPIRNLSSAHSSTDPSVADSVEHSRGATVRSTPIQRRETMHSRAKASYSQNVNAITVKAVVSIDPNLNETPDWIFSKAIRSSACMFIPMLEHQSKQFMVGAEFHKRLVDNKKVYIEVSERMTEAKTRARTKRDVKRQRPSL